MNVADQPLPHGSPLWQTSRMVEFLMSFFLSVGGSWLITTLLTERFKSSVKLEYDKQLEQHKSELQRQNNHELERHKDALRQQTDAQLAKLEAELETVVAERNFRFSHVFRKTEETIAAVYKALLALNQAVRHYTENPDAGDREIQKKVMESRAKEFHEAYSPNKIYIPQETAAKIEGFWSMVAHQWVPRFQHFQTAEANRSVGAHLHFSRLQEVEERAPQLLAALESDFQNILGFPGKKLT
jgi:hypothetical protein